MMETDREGSRANKGRRKEESETDLVRSLKLEFSTLLPAVRRFKSNRFARELVHSRGYRRYLSTPEVLMHYYFISLALMSIPHGKH